MAVIKMTVAFLGMVAVANAGHTSTSCSLDAAVSTGTASSPDDLDPQEPQQNAAMAVDGNNNTLWDQVDNVGGPHILQLAGPAPFAGYSFRSYAADNYAPKTWTLICDGSEIHAVTDYKGCPITSRIACQGDVPNSKGQDVYSTCLNAVHSCSILQMRISAWYSASPSIRELTLHPSTHTEAPTGNPSPGPTTNPTPGPTTNPSPGPTTNPSPGPTANPSPGPTPGPTSQMDALEDKMESVLAALLNMKGNVDDIKDLLNQHDQAPVCYGRRSQV